MTTFFTADTHFGHGNIIKHCHRPFRSVVEMDEELVRRWNATVGPEDEVWHLGDFAFACDWTYAVEIAARLNGIKFLVPGGHDHSKSGRMIGTHFRVQLPLTRCSPNGKQSAALCHYPLLTWWNVKRGVLMLHGHCHARNVNAAVSGNRVDVGVDAWDYAPVSWELILEATRSGTTDQKETEG